VLTARLDGSPVFLHESRWDDQEQMLRLAAREGRLVAPCCGARLVLKWGRLKVRHLAHAPRTDCPYERWSEPESPEHVAGKVQLFEWCRRVFGAAANLIAMEHPLAETLQRPDVYLELADGTRYALEYQRSPINLEDWEQRHQGYQQLGIHDIWVFGENRLGDALPTEEQQARWSAKEPHMQFLKLRAFEWAAAVRTPFEVAWWRGDHQEELWEPLEIDARVGREISPWYKRSALARLRSISFLDAGTGQLRIYRAMRELPGHTEVAMASIILTTPLDDPSLELEPTGFALPQDAQRLSRHEDRVMRLEALAAGARVRQESAPAQQALPEAPPVSQEEEQRRRLADRAGNPQWRRIVDRYGLTPENLHYLIGIPIPDDTVIAVHRTVWQAYIYYRLIYEQHRRSLATREVARLLERLFGFDPEMVRQARYLRPGEVRGPEEVVGQFLLLLADAGYLRSDRRSEHLRFYSPDEMPPPLTFRDRSQRGIAWSGLLAGQLRREGDRLVGPGLVIQLSVAKMADHPTPAQVEAVTRLVQRRDLDIDLGGLTFTEASRLLSEWKAKA